MITHNLLNVIQKFSHGLFHVFQQTAVTPSQQINSIAMGQPIQYRANQQLPSGGYTNVSKDAASYWASLPLLELPETNLTPHYLQDFINHPPMEAA